MRRWLVVMVCSLVVLAGCRDDGSPTITPGPTTDPSTATTASTATTVTTSPSGPTTTLPDEAGGIDPLDGASTNTVSVPATNRAIALLTAVRAARHEGYDRVVFEFRNVLPGYEIGYTNRPVAADGSGDEVTVNGANLVKVRFEAALDADLSQESAPRTYTGPDRFTPGTPEVTEIVKTGGFEGVLTWVVGLRDRVDFRVTTLASPPRVVIDFRNH